MDFSNSGGFPSRRSYPNLNHVSLAPLTPRFPIDDDIEPEDYFNSRHGNNDNNDGHDHLASGARTPPRTSYLSSVSVPSTPPILSHSRSSSRTRHARSKSSTRAALLSDTNLHSKQVALALHHHQASHKKQASASHPRRQFGDAASSKSDAEWMLRAGIALASSTREEKGQSWLSKRESSTSLVDMSLDDATTPHSHRHHHRTKSGASLRKSRSGTSTPGGYSRRSSRSRGGSRRGSRAGLTMTTIPPLSSASSVAAGKASSPGVGTMSPVSCGRGEGLVPDFVDESIRAEMASLQRERGFSDDESEFWDGEDDNDSEYDSFSDEAPDEFDEADLQRLTRERGFGLGSWIDRLVEWTLFGVEEWPATAPAPGSTAPAATRIGTTATSTIVTFEEAPNVTAEGENRAHDTLSLASAEDDEGDTLSHTDGESVVSVEKPGAQGGWEDASWLFRVMKRALV
ncbi:uncharacterized protein N7473_005517 [Penicillium subrubescens]|uniref:uncharacterized protein n=1 Tax=Penicillium subrubescens TaxID=1316194 RepID=UPI002545026F|nr:uncharacterized protein N7473_005517 [Penicillium subrubescens]KAJ5896118.1 hypothetical protein N7473_005517 [Penicillium subrubescens]